MLQKNNQLQKELDDMKTMHMNQEKLVKKLEHIEKEKKKIFRKRKTIRG